MKSPICSVCQQSQFILKAANLTIEKDGKVLHLENTPVQICTQCGEKYIDDAVIADISKALDIVFSSDTQIEIQEL